MNQLIGIINTILNNKGIAYNSKITQETDFRVDLNFDSLDLAELTVRCEQAFGIDVFDDGIVSTVKEVLAKING